MWVLIILIFLAVGATLYSPWYFALTFHLNVYTYVYTMFSWSLKLSCESSVVENLFLFIYFICYHHLKLNPSHFEMH